jgi:hypothetical protein
MAWRMQKTLPKPSPKVAHYMDWGVALMDRFTSGKVCWISSKLPMMKYKINGGIH